jgi:hypothetical protein
MESLVVSMHRSIRDGNGQLGSAVRDIMTREPYLIEPDADERDAAKYTLHGEVRRL